MSQGDPGRSNLGPNRPADPQAPLNRRQRVGTPWLLFTVTGLVLIAVFAAGVWLALTTPAADQSAASREPERATTAKSDTGIKQALQYRQPGQDVSLIPAPVEAVTDRTPIGPMPRIADDGRSPAQIYARPFNHKDPRPRVALLLTDLGLDAAATRQAIEDLPDEVSLAFVAFADGLQTWIDRARADGHEALLAVPMEPKNFPQNDPGPNALLSNEPRPKNLVALRLSLVEATGYTGLAPFMGAAFMADGDKLRPVFDEIAERGLFFADTRPGLISEAEEVAAATQASLVTSAIRLDAEPNAEAIDTALKRLEKLARERGAALGVFNPFPVSYQRVAAWSRSLNNKGLVLAPVSALTGYTNPDAAPPGAAEKAGP